MDITRKKYAGKLLLLSYTFLMVACQPQQPAEPDATVADSQPETVRTAWVDAERLGNPDAEPENWLAHGRTWSEQRYSPLDQVNTSNVNELGLAWHLDLDTARGQDSAW